MLKRIITPALLLFVAFSVGYLVVGKADRPSPPAASPAVAAMASPALEPPAPAASVSPDVASTGLATSETSRAGVPASRTVAYYFHSTQRCRTCLKIEQLARDTLTEQFKSELAQGGLEWHALNTDEPVNQHFAKDYELVASSLVLVNIRDGVQTSWKNLDKVWDLVGDEAAFQRYVAEETRAYLEQ